MKNLLPLLTVLLSLSFILGCQKEETKSLSLDVTNLSLEVGETYSFNARINPSHIDIRALSWKSSDNSVVSVNEMGEIEALSIGEATVSVYYFDYSLEGSCKVKVEPSKAKGISLSETSLTIDVKDSYELIAIFNPEGTTNKNIIWSSSDINIATVSQNGTVIGVSEGAATITAISEDGNFKAECDVKVLINMYITSYSKEMLITTEEYIRAIDKHGESYIGASWESLNPDIATISKKDDEEIEVMVIQAVGLGTTTITATSTDGKKTLECEIEVRDITEYVHLKLRSGGKIEDGFYSGTFGFTLTQSTGNALKLLSLGAYDNSVTPKKLIEGAYLDLSHRTLLPTYYIEPAVHLDSSYYMPEFILAFIWNDKEYSVSYKK